MELLDLLDSTGGVMRTIALDLPVELWGLLVASLNLLVMVNGSNGGVNGSIGVNESTGGWR